MKKNLIKIFAVSLGILCSVTAIAQQAEEKPRTADLSKNADKERSKPTDPAVAKELEQQKVLSENDLPKPIVPGGEFKPTDTDKPFTGNSKTTGTEKYQPVAAPVQNTSDPAVKDKQKSTQAQPVLQKG